MNRDTVAARAAWEAWRRWPSSSLSLPGSRQESLAQCLWVGC